MTAKSYSHLISLPTFEERFAYLQCNGVVGESTFGFDRILNQRFYTSKEWRDTRQRIILRDNACDLAFQDCPILGQIFIHHINPITINDIAEATEFLLNPENLVCISYETHNLLHYGGECPKKSFVERAKNDTCPWRIKR